MLIAILKDILLNRVTMKVEIEEKLFTLFKNAFAELFGLVDRGVECFAGFVPLAVEVTGCQRTSVVTIYDSVNVKHGNYVELKVVL